MSSDSSNLIRLTLSENDIERGLIRVTNESRNQFPSDSYSYKKLPPEKDLQILLPNGSSYSSDICTDADGKPRFVRKSSAFKKYLKEANVKPGSRLEIERIGDRKYKVHLIKEDAAHIPKIIYSPPQEQQQSPCPSTQFFMAPQGPARLIRLASLQ